MAARSEPGAEPYRASPCPCAEGGRIAPWSAGVRWFMAAACLRAGRAIGRGLLLLLLRLPLLCPRQSIRLSLSLSACLSVSASEEDGGAVVRALLLLSAASGGRGDGSEVSWSWSRGWAGARTGFGCGAHPRWTTQGRRKMRRGLQVDRDLGAKSAAGDGHVRANCQASRHACSVCVRSQSRS